jgi:hypothetical protein
MRVLIDELRRLSAPVVLATYTHFEVTEIFAFATKGASPLNVFTLIVGQEGPISAPNAANKSYLSPKLLQIRSLRDWRFGIARYALSLADLIQVLETFDVTGAWAPSGQPAQVGQLDSVVGRFAPADQAFPHPWNGILKNNFWSGSHLLELADRNKPFVAPLLEDPRRLQDLSEAIRPIFPLEIARTSDRTGNVIIQLPVTVVMARLGRDRRTGQGLMSLAWHPSVPPRPLRFVWNRQFDGMHTGLTSQVINPGTAAFAVPKARGLETGLLWDDQNDVLLWSQAPTSFINQINQSTFILHPEKRWFWEGAGSERVQRAIELRQRGGASIVGGPSGTSLDDWSQKRIYRAERDRLAANRDFVQYVPSSSGVRADKERALNDLRELIKTYAEGGAWLWDPYLSAVDILGTLFHCPFLGSDLRALTDALVTPKPRGSPPRGWRRFLECLGLNTRPVGPSFTEEQRAILQANAGNGEGLTLEYRARIGHSGWSFHDRFLIFPETASGPLAWSLGTSVNALGSKHHILQRVGDGRLVADAFLELWDQLDQPSQLIWKSS